MLVATRDTGQKLEPAEARGVPAPTHAYLVAPLIAVVTLATTLIWGGQLGLELRDPDGIIGRRLVLVLGLVFVFWLLDVVPRAVRQARAASEPVWPRIKAVAGHRWSARRIAFVLGSIVAFYVTYLCYRNLKSYLPLARPELFDAQLLHLERSVFGRDPALMLHELLGTGISAHVLSTVYLLFLTFVPISIGVTLVWSTDKASALWWVSVLSISWILGVLSYFLLPSLGPVYAAPELFSGLPDTGTSALQQALLEKRQSFLASPVGSGGLQSIAAFASLHTAIVFAGALMAHLLRAPRALRFGMWLYLALTFLATIYFGWHYVVDDIAGFAIGFLSVYLGGLLTGWRIERRSPVAALQLNRV
jgi:membrane-associated phospholipid phosphatase